MLPLRIWLSLFVLSIAWHGFHQTAGAETKVIISEAMYIMGDGESPIFAEEMVLQKAKQLALEQAGTYVESYSKVRNLDLTVEEIQTLAGGMLQTEVLERRRALIGDGLQFFVKIKATVTTDQVEELAKRIKGKDVVAEYTRLQAEYARLSAELETWKQAAGKGLAQAERATAFNQMVEHQKALAAVWVSQDGLVRSLVSGHDMVVAADNEKDLLDELIRTIVTQGHMIEVGKGKVIRTDSEYRLIVPVTLKLKEEAFLAVADVARLLHGTVWPKLEVETINPVRVGTKDKRWEPVSITAARLSEDLLAATSFQKAIDRLTLLLELHDGHSGIAYCLPRPPNRMASGDHTDRWAHIRRIQPVSLLLRAKEGENKEKIHAINELLIDDWSLHYREKYSVLNMTEGYKRAARGPDGKVPPGYLVPHITTEKGYVALVRHEARFRVAISLSADFARSLKQIAATIIAGDPLSLPPEADMLQCTVLSEE